MKVVDKQTGCTLESNDQTTVDSWAANPERYVPADYPAQERKPRKGAPAGTGAEPCM